MVPMVWKNIDKKETTPGDEASPTLARAVILTKQIYQAGGRESI